MSEKEIDHTFTSEIVCPYCGYEFSDSWEYKEHGAVDCGNCDKKFLYEANYTVDYCTKKSACLNNEAPHDWIVLYETPKYKYKKCKKCDKYENEKTPSEGK